MADRNLKLMRTIQHELISKYFMNINFIFDSDEFFILIVFCFRNIIT